MSTTDGRICGLCRYVSGKEYDGELYCLYYSMQYDNDEPMEVQYLDSCFFFEYED